MRECKDVIAALRRLRVQTGSLACLGCGYEQSCGIHGCAILRAAADLLERDGTGLAPADEPLTIEQLREMDGEPVWLVIAGGVWGLIDTDDDCVWLDRGGSIGICKLAGRAYRHPPERQEAT